MNTLVLVGLTLAVIFLYGVSKRKQGAAERDKEAWLEHDDRLYDILEEEEKIRLMRHLDKMEPSDAIDLLRRGGLPRKEGQPRDNSPMRSNAIPPRNGKPKRSG